MKAAVHYKYGPPEVISIVDVPRPRVKPGQILIKNHATTVNRTDTGFRSAEYFISRFFSGLLRPKRPILGCEFAGEVVELGADVHQFKVGDRVFGFDDINWGGHGEFKAMDAGKLVATIPDGMDYQDVVAASEGAHYALTYIKALKLKPGARVMVNGGTGVIGSAAIQILTHKGISVDATSRHQHMDVVRGLGADTVVDYEVDDFTQTDVQYDAVFDAVGKSTFKACKPLIKPGGSYASSELGPHAQNPLLAVWTKAFGSKKVLFPIPKNKAEEIVQIKDMLADGSFKPLIDSVRPLEEIVEASRYAESGQKAGSIVLTF